MTSEAKQQQKCQRISRSHRRNSNSDSDSDSDSRSGNGCGIYSNTSKNSKNLITNIKNASKILQKVIN